MAFKLELCGETSIKERSKGNPTDSYCGQCDMPEIYRFGGFTAGVIYSLGLVICTTRPTMTGRGISRLTIF